MRPRSGKFKIRRPSSRYARPRRIGRESEQEYIIDDPKDVFYKAMDLIDDSGYQSSVVKEIVRLLVDFIPTEKWATVMLEFDSVGR